MIVRFLSQARQAGSYGDPVEPGPDAGIAAEAGHCAVNLHKNILHGLARILAIPEHPEGVVEDGVRVFIHKFAEFVGRNLFQAATSISVGSSIPSPRLKTSSGDNH